jgi:tetratricopeptide (TPR) repeat protein
MRYHQRMKSVRLLCLAITSICCTSIAPAQMDMASHSMGMAMKEIPPPDKLPAPIKMTGLGNSHIAIKATPEAQMWFDQGLNLLHDFWDYESARAFEQAVRVDPNCAMCYWGLYEALMFRHQQMTGYSGDALASAVRLEKQADKAGRMYIEAAVAANNAMKSDNSDDHKDTEILRELVKKYPNDLQAKIFLATSLQDGYDDKGEPKKGTKEAIAVLTEVLKIAPNDSAANHYWIHAVEASNKPEQALPSAALLASLSPTSGHMVHMPGHIYYRVGDYPHAEHWFAASTAADEAYMREQHIDIDDDWNYVHNLMYGIANLMEEGKLTQATALSSKLSGARGQFKQTLYVQSPRDGISRLDPLLPVALRTGDWPLVLKLVSGSKPDAKLENLTFLAGQLKEFATGMEAVNTGDIAAAQASSTKLDAELWHLSQKMKDAPKPAKEEPKAPFMTPVMPDAMPAPLLSSLSIMSLELRASILARQKDLPAAKKLFEQAARAEKALGYREPPTYIRPVGETEGLALLAAGDATGAHEAYVAALAERPNSGFGLYGMARSSEAAHDNAKATTEYQKFAEAWKDGDQTAPEMLHAKEFLAAQMTMASTSK